MAVYPCRHIKASPPPHGFLPRANSRKALAYLYPANDRALLACDAVPFGYRLLWGFLAREGMREGEALALTWGDVDLVRGMVKLDQNKTDDPRAWALNPGVARALAVYRQHFASEAQPEDSVFIPRSKWGLAETFRTHLERAGIKAGAPSCSSAATLGSQSGSTTCAGRSSGWRWPTAAPKRGSWPAPATGRARW
jgi:integrase